MPRTIPVQRLALARLAAILPLAAAALAAWPAAAAGSPPLGVYRCATETVEVAHCDAYCDVHYPDRPRPRGALIQRAVPAAETAAQLRGCRLTESFEGAAAYAPNGAPGGRLPAAPRRAAAGPAGKAPARRLTAADCAPGNVDCAYAVDPSNPGRIMNQPYAKPYAEPYAQPYAPPFAASPLPGASPLATSGYGPPK